LKPETRGSLLAAGSRFLLLFVGGFFLWPLGGLFVLWISLIAQLLSLALAGALPVFLLWMAMAKRRKDGGAC
jgi:Flp pilus assembly protein TadB